MIVIIWVVFRTSYDVAGGEEVSICILSPTGGSLAYVKANNVFYRPNLVVDDEVHLTEDGVPGVIYNGVPDWVYEGICSIEII